LIKYILYQFKLLKRRVTPMKALFTRIYRVRAFGGEISVSGPGSDLYQTEIIRREIPNLLKEFNIKTLVDAPCGDFYWMRTMKLDLEKYIGVDIVTEIIAKNQQKYADKNRRFITLDITKDTLPQADMVLSRDALVHFSYKDIFSSVKNFKKSNLQYLLTTTFTETTNNRDVVTGSWRPLNLLLHPFYFPPPITLINEKSTEGNGVYSDKCLGLWRLEDINV
jgi:hypothetical protein